MQNKEGYKDLKHIDRLYFHGGQNEGEFDRDEKVGDRGEIS
mgnify:CR=1 FL=1